MKTTIPNNPHGRIMAVKELASLLKVHRDTLCLWRKEGKGPPYYKVNRLVHYREKDVMDWLEKSRREG
jgi:excisionase family DNA binding protein